jgi:metal-responsive CopG/Arc/MetJ family transcriptional regulator
MKVNVAFNLDAHLLDKIDELKIKRGTNRSETVRHILGEYFKSGTTFGELIDELERMKVHNFELKYQLQELVELSKKHDKETVTMLLLLGGNDEIFKREIRKRLPHYWPKK